MSNGKPRLNAFPLASLPVIVLVAGACATTPREPGAPTPEEAPLVERSHAFCAAAGHPAGVPPKPFTTDACTLWIDGNLRACCVEHDIAYWCGGTEEQRREADQAFRACARENSPGQSGLVYYGVRAGGVPWMPTTWRWGYGHAFGSGYAEPAPDGSETEGDTGSAAEAR